MNVYDYSLPLPNGETLNLKDYEGKVLLIVNTATHCGYTPQYKELQRLYEKYKEHGFEIIDIPCNQFKEQASEDDAGIASFCSLNYGTTFMRARKSDVNGENALPIYTYLKEACPFKGFGAGAKAIAMNLLLSFTEKNYRKSPDIKWNFTKFLIDRKGNAIMRFEPNEKMDHLEEMIVHAL